MSLRRKLFTRAEKRAFRELYKATKGFKEFPKTGNPRDTLRLKRLAEDFRRYSLGDTKGIDIENAKQVLQNAGLHQTANGLEHSINKYSNKRALVRLRNIKNANKEKDLKSLKRTFKKRIKRTERRIDDLEKTNLSALQEMNQRVIPTQADISKDKVAHAKLRIDSKKRGINLVNSDTAPKDLSWDGPAQFYGEWNNTHIDPKTHIKSAKYTKGTGMIYMDKSAENNLNILAHEYGHARSGLQTRGKSGITRVLGLDNKGVESNTKSSLNYGKDRLMAKSRDLRKAGEAFQELAEEEVANSYAQARLNKLGRGFKFGKFARINRDTYTSANKGDLLRESASNTMDLIRKYN